MAKGVSALDRLTLDEFAIQNALWAFSMGRNHWAAAPNVYIFHNESDFLGITKARITHEYEIKLTRSDFNADFKKYRHQYYGDAETEYARPNYFWYVAPRGLLDPADVPEYAGLIQVSGNRVHPFTERAKNAPKLHGGKISDHELEKVFRASMFRYWSVREKLTALEEKQEGCQ